MIERTHGTDNVSEGKRIIYLPEMNRSGDLLLLLVLAALSSTLAFAPSRRRSASLYPALYASSDDEGGGASTINVALITSSVSTVGGTRHHEGLHAAIEVHPFCKMTGIRFSIADVPVASSAILPSWTKEHVSRLRKADIACFEDASAVLSYLKVLDEHHDVPESASEEYRRRQPNKPDLVREIIGGVVPKANDGTATLMMAACPDSDTARECLNSGRWTSNHIYYPKVTQGAVELKILPISGGGEDGEDARGAKDGAEGGGAIDVDVWADSVVQAAGDVMERKFWGGGW
jgi:hypothetical protein